MGGAWLLGESPFEVCTPPNVAVGIFIFLLSVFCFVDFVLFSLSLCQVREQQRRGSLVWSIVLGKREENYDDERYGEEKREVGRVERKC